MTEYPVIPALSDKKKTKIGINFHYQIFDIQEVVHMYIFLHPRCIFPLFKKKISVIHTALN